MPSFEREHHRHIQAAVAVTELFHIVIFHNIYLWHFFYELRLAHIFEIFPYFRITFFTLFHSDVITHRFTIHIPIGVNQVLHGFVRTIPVILRERFRYKIGVSGPVVIVCISHILTCYNILRISGRCITFVPQWFITEHTFYEFIFIDTFGCIVNICIHFVSFFLLCGGKRWYTE